MAEFYSATLKQLSTNLSPAWKIQDWSQGRLFWRSFFLLNQILPHQGWKIHVSSGAVEVADMCFRVIPLLLQLQATFKIARRFDDVVFVNSGDGGASLLGKIVTIYPLNDAQAKAIALALDEVWPVSRGPEVQTDLHIRPGSAVSFRYGAFGSGPVVAGETGNYEMALQLPNGDLVQDVRHLSGGKSQAAWVPPVEGYPPRQHPIALHEPFTLNGSQYVALTLLSERPGKKIFLGLCSTTLNSVVIKVGYPGVAGDHRGVDVRENMRKECEILVALIEEEGLAPKLLQWVDDEWPITVMEDFRGELLSELSPEQQVARLPDFAKALVRLHRTGFVHGDIKLENAVLRDNCVGLIDFELSEREGIVVGAGGTRGHMGSEVVADSVADFSRDIFALGGCVAHAVLGIPPALLPPGVGRLRGLLSLEDEHEASVLVRDLCHSDPAARPTACEAEVALRAQQFHLSTRSVSWGRASDIQAMEWCRRASIQAASLVDRYWTDEGQGWRNEHFMSSFRCEGINIGAAGIIIGLSTIDHALGRSDFQHHVDKGAEWLASRPSMKRAVGFFTGDTGVAIALALSGVRLGNERYMAAAKNRFESACANLCETDLFSGSAGVLWGGCILSQMLQESWPLETAFGVAQHLAIHRGDVAEIPVWTTDPSSDSVYLGCAHGSAGIAMALGCWGRLIGQPNAIDMAVETFHLLYKHGRTPDGQALRITGNSHRHHAVGNWCHGVAGYLWAILQGVGDSAALREEIEWAVEVLTNQKSIGTPTYCHGLAGQLEIWRMLSGIPRFKTLAQARAGKVVRALRNVHEKRQACCTWISDDPDIVTPDLWVGFLGPATALALHACGRQSPLFSGEWLRDCSTACGLQGAQG